MSGAYLMVAVASLTMVVSAAGVPAAAETAPVALAPHQALYSLSLKTTRNNVAINDASGRILYNFDGNACEGYSSDFHQISELDAAENNDVTSNLRSTAWESADGKSYRFHIETRTNDEEPEIVDGVAERGDDGIVVRLKEPTEKTLTLARDVVFPTEQIRRVIAAARAGKSLLELNVYDGSDGGEKVFNTFTVIGQPITPGAAVPADAVGATLKMLPRWPVTISYFDSSKKSGAGEQTPASAMSFELYENGVSRALALDYGDFVIAGAMSQFDAKPVKLCKP